ncbi:MAG: substrate-binding domain-containing protein [Armatimonadetes bacterium]|nr:substrate-binding domain-containing protein [Armatimonadota bacterium]
MKLWHLALTGLAVVAAGCNPPDNGGPGQTTGTSGSTGTTSGSTTSGPKGPSGGGSLKIAMIPKGTAHEFWKSVHAGADEAAKAQGVELIWKGPLKEDDRDAQIQVVEDQITAKVDGICLAPLDDKALRTPVDSALKAKIPVLIFDSALADATGTVSFVATDNKKGGSTAGEAMVAAIGKGGKVIVLRYQSGSASTTERETGFIEAAKAGGLEIVSENQFAGASVETAQKAAENLLNRFKGPDGNLAVAGIFCPNESSTFGMLRALQDAKLAGKVKFYGFDSSPKLVDGLAAGEIDGLVVQNPFNMGKLAVESIVKQIRGEKVEARIDTGATLATKANMETEEVKKVLNPPKI